MNTYDLLWGRHEAADVFQLVFKHSKCNVTAEQWRQLRAVASAPDDMLFVSDDFILNAEELVWLRPDSQEGLYELIFTGNIKVVVTAKEAEKLLSDARIGAPRPSAPPPLPQAPPTRPPPVPVSVGKSNRK